MAESNSTIGERQMQADRLRAVLSRAGVYPTVQGERAVKDCDTEIYHDLVALLPGLETNDLFCLEVLAHHFTGTKVSGWRERHRACIAAIGGSGRQPAEWWWQTFVMTLGYTRHLLTEWVRAVYGGGNG